MCDYCELKPRVQVFPCKLNTKETDEGLKMLQVNNGWLKYKELDDGWIEYRGIYVTQKQRRKGIGSKLLQKLRKIGKIKTFVNTNSEDWLGKFLLSVGFKFSDEKHPDYQTIMIYE